MIERYDKFRSRARLRLRFIPLGEDEIVTTVLPQLTAIPRWIYSVTNPDDCQMGRDLWQRVNPSLRDLVSVLDTASQIAETHALPKILPETIQEAFPWAGLDPGMAVSSASLPKDPPPQTDEDKGEKEQESADRAEGKRRRHAH